MEGENKDTHQDLSPLLPDVCHLGHIPVSSGLRFFKMRKANLTSQDLKTECEKACVCLDAGQCRTHSEISQCYAQ